MSKKENIDTDNASKSKPDLDINIPNLKIGETELDVENLNADLSLSAEIDKLVNVNIGIAAKAEKVNLSLKEIEGEVTVKVHLERIENILLNAFKLLNNNPKILENLNRNTVSSENDPNESGLSDVFKKASDKISR